METVPIDQYSKMTLVEMIKTKGTTQYFDDTKYADCKDGKEVILDMESFIRDRFDK